MKRTLSICIRYTSVVPGWTLFCLHSSCAGNIHQRFWSMLTWECHAVTADLLTAHPWCQSGDCGSPFECSELIVMLKKAVWDDLSFVIWHIMWLASKPSLRTCMQHADGDGPRAHECTHPLGFVPVCHFESLTLFLTKKADHFNQPLMPYWVHAADVGII